ncbi:MAG: dihydroorotate dehydrogenase [Eubacteriales bacterium]|nr:dihydroorotate dehydrogenase [Eubacteriales bacterium]
MDFSVELLNKKLANPLMPASGCFAFGQEAATYQDIKLWGALVSKTVTLEPRLGNPAPRVVETAAGMLNSIGLQNPGLEVFLQEKLPFMQAHSPAVVVNIAGNRVEDYVQLCERLEGQDIWAIELNLSCPNVQEGGMAMGTRPDLIRQVTAACKAVTNLPLIAKLTPNVTDIVGSALAAQEGGADAVSLVNTFLGLAVDLQSRRPALKNDTGGLSGPCIKPLALRMVAQVYQAVDIPIIGLGGIRQGRDVLEFLLAGARAVQIGSANFADPNLPQRILKELQEECEKLQISSWDSWIGALKYWKS